MTFDEVLDEMNANQEPSESIRFMEQLRQEYAPTVEMTQEQHEAFVESVEGIATQEQLDSFVDEELDLGDMTVRKGLNAWLHPETIKIVDE